MLCEFKAFRRTDGSPNGSRANTQREKQQKVFRGAIVLPLALLLVLSLVLPGCKKAEEEFTFAFLTDIHVQPEKQAGEGMKKAVAAVNDLKPDFVITGGDQVMDSMAQTEERSTALYALYVETAKGFAMPVHNTIGNHEHFGWEAKDNGVGPDHPEFGKKMFMNRMGGLNGLPSDKTYHSFDHKGWHFMILDSVGRRENGSYYGLVDEEQMAWIAGDLAKIDKKTPICISVHIPFISAMTQLRSGSTFPNNPGIVITNSKKVLNLFSDYNLKLVLQGHLHFLEDIYVNGIHFITGGAVCASWWDGPRMGMEEGFLLVECEGETIEWEYIDYGWNVAPAEKK